MAIGKFVVAGVSKIGAAALKMVIKNRITGEGVGFDILKEETSEVTGTISSIATNRINEYFFQPKTIRQKLDAILTEEFQELNTEEYDGKFGEYLDYLSDADDLLDSEEDIKKSMIEWNQNARTSVSKLSLFEINSFVADYFENVKTRIRKDAVLKQYLKVLQTSQTVENIIEEIYKIQNTIDNLATKEDLQKILEEFKILYPKQMNEVKKITGITSKNNAYGNRIVIGDIEATNGSNISSDNTAFGTDIQIGGIKIFE
ncbi:MAG: hypothetical protein K2K06_06695 [Oscillospiraceae bacterium]|nr:hypothetical protein [Oscillospiraceae bacterium]